jgi:hypothetical protein
MRIPGLYESFVIFDQERPQTVDFRRPKAMRLGKTDRLQPKLRNVVAVFDIYVRRLGSVEAIEEEPEARYSPYSRHGLPQNAILAIAPIKGSYLKCPATLKSS